MTDEKNLFELAYIDNQSLYDLDLIVEVYANHSQKNQLTFEIRQKENAPKENIKWGSLDPKISFSGIKIINKKKKPFSTLVCEVTSTENDDLSWILAIDEVCLTDLKNKNNKCEKYKLVVSDNKVDLVNV